MYRKRSFFTICLAFLLLTGLCAQSKSTQSTSTQSASGLSPREILDQARLPGHETESLVLLEKNLPVSAELAPYFLLELTRLSAEGGNWDKALSWSARQNAGALPPSVSDEVIYWRGQALLHTGSEKTALDLYRKALDSGKVSNPRLYLAWFRIASSGAETITARFDKAFPLLKSTDPETFALSRYLGGVVAVRSGEWSFAVQSFTRFSPAYDKILPDSAPWSHYYRAYSLYRLGRWDEAVTEFTYYLDTWKNHAFSWQAATNAAFAAMQAGFDPLPFAVRSVRLAPTNTDLAESTLLQASILIDAKQYSEAESLLTGIVDGKTTKGVTASAPRALYMLAETAVAMKNSDLAEQRWLTLLSKFPNDPLAEESLYRSGELRYISSDWNAGADLFTRYRSAFTSGRFLDTVLWSGGDSYNRAGNTDLAILWWQELVKKYPKSPFTSRAYSELIDSYRKKGEYASAVKTAEAYKVMFPSDAALNEVDTAIGELNKLAHGENADTAALLTSYIQAKRASTAEGRSIGLRLSRLYLADYSKRTEAKDILREIIAKTPRSVSSLSALERNTFAASLSLLGNIYRDETDYRAASSSLLQAGNLYASIDGERSAEALYGAADCFLQAGQNADARTTVETLKKTWPDSVWTRRADMLMPKD